MILSGGYGQSQAIAYVSFHKKYNSVHTISTATITHMEYMGKTVKSYRSHVDPWHADDLRFCTPQPDTSLYCKTMDTELMHLISVPVKAGIPRCRHGHRLSKYGYSLTYETAISLRQNCTYRT